MTQNRSETVETLEALTGGTEHLDFVAGVIRRSELPPHVSQELLQRIERIRGRCNDPNLYMAVIGEFSSGKSTFINALLRDDLLKTDALVTTAAATRLQHGDSLEAKVVFKKPRRHELKLDQDSKKFTVDEIPELNARNIREFIQAVTSQGAVAPRVSDVTITHPALFLSDSTVIIDTPGMNATHQEHVAITAQVVEHEADAAIVMVPAIFPLSRTLIDFLAGRLQPCLHRCVFVVTRMDQIREKERAGLLHNIRQRLEVELGVKLSAVHACSAQAVIDSLTGGPLASNGVGVWRDRFAELEQAITSRLLRERTLSIAERILRLLTQLFAELEGHIRNRREEFERRSEALKKEVIRDLGSFAKEQHKVCQGMFKSELSTLGSKVDEEVSRFRVAVRSASRSAVYDITDKSEFAGLQEKLEGVIKREHEKFSKNLEAILKKMGGAAEKVGKVFDKKFKEQYRRLAAIEGVSNLRREALQESDFKLDTGDILSSSMSVNQELSNKDDNWVGGFGVAGLVIGSIIFPVIGSIIGAYLGGWFGSFFGPSLAERQKQIWEKLDPKLDTYLDSAGKGAKDALNASGKLAQAALDKRLDAYIAKYKSVVDAMVLKQNEELEELKRLQRAAQSDLAEIDRRRGALGAQQKRLAHR